MLETIKTTEYFMMTEDELLFVPSDGETTVEERKIYKIGTTQTFFDDMNEYEEEKEVFERWIKTDYPESKQVVALETVNGRVVLIYG
ncbi:hypothetical protein [Clostridium sp. HBUAS56010]|uniref:hypothetical protein n=1 Tax=Clostridium sp. HBUAS56010 TaxID=2571127 RepID=UPI001178C7EA|nr:hypothetical protein [Clostridium sp. HBUAS56010]